MDCRITVTTVVILLVASTCALAYDATQETDPSRETCATFIGSARVLLRPHRRDDAGSCDRPAQRVYTLTDDLVWMGYFEDPTGASGEPPGWNLVTRNNQKAVSGLYLLHVDSPHGSELTRFVIVR